MAGTSLVAKALILDGDDNVLLLKRSASHPALAHQYDLPGGIVEPGEEPGAGVTREIAEETGLVIDGAVAIYAAPIFSSGRNYPTILYAVRLDEPKPGVTLSWEHEAYEWAPLDRVSEVEPQLDAAYPDALTYIRTNDLLKDL